MNKRQLAAKLAKVTDVSVAEIVRVISALGEAVLEELEKRGRFEWRGVGTFTVRTYAARKIYNPPRGKTIPLLARRRVIFKSSTRLRALLRGRHSRRGKTTS